MQDFDTKRAALFACLDDASKELKGTALDQSNNYDQTMMALIRTSNEDEVKLYNKTKRFTPYDSGLSRMRGKESIFKKPEMPLTKCLKPRSAPDWQLNPHKWKKYSLEDVDISDHTNTAAAFSFLKEMDERKEAEEDEDAIKMKANKKIEFKKSCKIARKLKEITTDEVADAEVDKPKLKGSRLVMPEYVIGQQQKQHKKKKITAQDNKKRAAGALTLSHLQEIDDIDDDDDEN